MEQRKYQPEPEDIGTILERLDRIEQGQKRLDENEEARFNALVEQIDDEAKEIKETMATKEDITGLATKEDLEALKEAFRDLLIKHLRPGGNGH